MSFFLCALLAHRKIKNAPTPLATSRSEKFQRRMVYFV
eukprot:UN05039